jgi:glutaredoxin
MKVRVEVFTTPGCDQCRRARETLKSIAESFGADKVSWREVDVLEELDYAVELGVTCPPAVAIDGVLIFPALPSAERFRRELDQRLRSATAADAIVPRRGRDGH